MCIRDSVKDPYLYVVEALLTVHNETIDNVSANLGVRTYTVDPQKLSLIHISSRKTFVVAAAIF